MLGGVCAGIAEYFDLDPTVVRLLTVLLVVVGNAAAVIVYIVMWIAVPEEPLGVPHAGERERGPVMAEESNRSTSGVPGPDSPPPPPPHTATPPPGHQPSRVTPETGVGPEGRGRSGAWLGAVLIFIGVALLVQMFVPEVRLWEYWPVIIIVAGILMIVRPGRGTR